MATKIPCTKCGAMILPTTAEKNGGLCMPCVSPDKLKKKHKPITRLQELGIMTAISVVCYGLGWAWISDVISHTDSLDRSYWKPNMFGDIAHSAMGFFSLIIYVLGNILQIIGMFLVPLYLVYWFKESRHSKNRGK